MRSAARQGAGAAEEAQGAGREQPRTEQTGQIRGHVCRKDVATGREAREKSGSAGKGNGENPARARRKAPSESAEKQSADRHGGRKKTAGRPGAPPIIGKQARRRNALSVSGSRLSLGKTLSQGRDSAPARRRPCPATSRCRPARRRSCRGCGACPPPRRARQVHRARDPRRACESRQSTAAA